MWSPHNEISVFRREERPGQTLSPHVKGRPYEHITEHGKAAIYQPERACAKQKEENQAHVRRPYPLTLSRTVSHWPLSSRCLRKSLLAQVPGSSGNVTELGLLHF